MIAGTMVVLDFLSPRARPTVGGYDACRVAPDDAALEAAMLTVRRRSATTRRLGLGFCALLVVSGVSAAVRATPSAVLATDATTASCGAPAAAATARRFAEGSAGAMRARPASRVDLPYFTRGAKRDACAPHTVYVELAHDDAGLRTALARAASPDSPRFREYWTRADIASTFVTGDGAAVAAFLGSFGVEAVRSRSGAFVVATAPVFVIEAAFGCAVYDYAPSSSSFRTVARCDGAYAVHEAIDAHVAAVHGLSGLPARARSKPRRATAGSARARRRAEAGESALVTPAVLVDFYGVRGNGTGVRQSVFETDVEDYSPSDLATFEDTFSLPRSVVTDVGGHVGDGICESDADACAESNLDVQYVTALAPGALTTYWYVEEGDLDPFTAYAVQLDGAELTPLVNSISYGSFESENAPEAMDAFDRAAIKLGLEGASVFVSSGDDGAPNAIGSVAECAYNPSYPATSPFVTAVGATYKADWADGARETVCQSDVDDAVITSGGGFSIYQDAPPYARSAQGAYLDATNATAGYNARGRGYPDVSLAGYGYEMVIGGDLYTVSGTSASSPSVAAMATLVNALRLRAGAPPVGFLNPTLYADPTFANDVVEGDTRCVANNEFCCAEGFDAAAGWDPATGLGSVDYPRFEALLTADVAPADLENARKALNV